MSVDFEPNGMIVGLPGVIVAWGIHVVIPVVFGVVAFLRSRAYARQARVADSEADAVTANLPLAPGRACLHGPVEMAPGSSLAVSVSIAQSGQNFKKKGKYTHAWKETRRTVRSAPFYVRDRRGTRVRIEPDERTLLVDKADRTVRHGEAVRERIAELSEGEVVYVVGELAPGRDPGAGGYRDAETVLVMRPPPGGRLLVSTESLGERFRRDQASHRYFAIFFLVYIFVFALVDIGFHARVFLGRVEQATIVTLHPHSGKSSYCEMEVTVPGRAASFYVQSGYGWCKTLAPGKQVPVYLVGSGRFAIAGREPAFAGGSLGIALAPLFIVLILYLQRSRPWYDAKLTEGGAGKLSESS